ncbi:type II toxin-antitoxin system RelE family toxin [Candidatus Electrothrix sp.]|uniref:type II toxin-antitoxin system RelE family toxin n=1 Tax=Candidatus Electrothrix sp. TaxID=2170559 RepID=UPI004056F23F
MYEVRVLDDAVRDLKRLDKPVGRRTVRKISWLAENLENINNEQLSGNLSDFYKFRVGAYRVLYQVLEKESVLLIHHIGHRREIYRK